MMIVEHTLAMIKPEGMPNEKRIIARLKKEGFVVLDKRVVHLTPEQVSDFYQELYGRRDFPLLVATTSVAPVTALCLGRLNAVEKLKEVVGPSDVTVAQAEYPGSVNALFGNSDCNLPAVHASEDALSAVREIQFFFPGSAVEPTVSVEDGLRWLDKELRPLLTQGLAELLKEKPAEPLLWLADWLLTHNPRLPQAPFHLSHQHFEH